MQEAELPVAQPLPSHKRFTDLTGRKFVRYTVLYYAGMIASGGNKKTQWVCQCDCGEKRLVDSWNLRVGNSGSCGCLRAESMRRVATKHGLTANKTKVSEIGIWSKMKDRCYNTESDSYCNYGGRGITVCEEWLGSFEAFYNDMGKRPSPDHSIERVDNNGNYCKENCVWTDRKTQGRNKRNNIKVMFEGREYVLSELAELTGLDYSMLRARVSSGWPDELLTQPTGTWRASIANGRIAVQPYSLPQ